MVTSALNFIQPALSSTCYLFIFSSTTNFNDLLFHQPTILSTCYFIKFGFINFPFRKCTSLTICHFASIQFCQHVILSILIYQHAVLSTCHFINLLFYQLVTLSIFFLFHQLSFSQLTVYSKRHFVNQPNTILKGVGVMSKFTLWEDIILTKHWGWWPFEDKNIMPSI